MSYILDALKRAETERNGAATARDALPASFVAAAPARPALRALRWLGPVLAAVAIGMFLLNRPSDTPPPPAPEAVLPASAQSALSATSPTASSTALATTSPAAAQQVAAAPPAVIIPPPAAHAPMPAPAPTLTPAASPPAKQKPAIGTLRDLPVSIQREIPPLAVGGYLYSATAADRTVLINKRLRREGDEIAPGLVLERLTPNGMVLSYRGHRFRNSY